MLRDRILSRLQIQQYRIRDIVIWGVVLTSGASLLLNLVDVAHLGTELVHWAEAWLLDFSTDIAGGGLTFLFFKWFAERQGTPPEILDDPADSGYPKTTFYIEAEEVSIPDATIELNLEKRRAELLKECIARLQASETPESRKVVLELMVKENLFAQIQLLDVSMQRAELNHVDLHGADLTRSNLRGARLAQANLQEAILYMTQLIEGDLRGANLNGANLERAFMSGADLSGASLVGARVQTSLWGVNLQNANLGNADLRGAELFRTDLRGADLLGAHLEGARINSETLLPDGSHWNGRSDLKRFTEPSHPAFWRSADPQSPAYKPS